MDDVILEQSPSLGRQTADDFFQVLLFTYRSQGAEFITSSNMQNWNKVSTRK